MCKVQVVKLDFKVFKETQHQHNSLGSNTRRAWFNKKNILTLTYILQTDTTVEENITNASKNVEERYGKLDLLTRSIGIFVSFGGKEKLTYWNVSNLNALIDTFLK